MAVKRERSQTNPCCVKYENSFRIIQEPLSVLPNTIVVMSSRRLSVISARLALRILQGGMYWTWAVVRDFLSRYRPLPQAHR